MLGIFSNGIFSSGNFQNVQFTKRQFPKGGADCKGGPSAAARPDLGSFRLGNCTIGKITLGCCCLGKSLLKNTLHQFLVIQPVFSRLNCGRCTNNHPYNRDLGKIKKYIFLDDSTKSFNFYNLNPVDLSYNFSYDTGNKDDIIMATPSQFIRFLNLFHFYFMLKLQNQAY